LFVLGLAGLVPGRIAAAQTSPVPNTDSSSLRGGGGLRVRGGWYPWDPYQYREYRHGVPILTGFDVEIVRALARIMAAGCSPRKSALP
jgi:hypothetical protein